MVYDLMQALNNPSQGGGGSGECNPDADAGPDGQEQMAMNILTEQLNDAASAAGRTHGASMQQQIKSLPRPTTPGGQPETRSAKRS
jgi:hypothetical protein